MSNPQKQYDLSPFKGIIICKQSGEYLLDLILDSEIDPVLLSSFVGALSLFGKDNFGKIEEITIKGLDVQMVIVNKYGLVLITILDKSFPLHNIRKEAEKALDNFYLFYQDQFDNCIDVDKFDSFKSVLRDQIKKYFKKLETRNDLEDIGDFGFFTNAIKKMRDLEN
ncbi:MAG: hypothetical protein BAJALOKI2v1_80089 [Promethearchaeota archaeon]|nr:MAG: hypothetical protein BAJALOKI2v1_80089 [Candidatus Lokiarchaeota archaeon]